MHSWTNQEVENFRMLHQHFEGDFSQILGHELMPAGVTTIRALKAKWKSIMDADERAATREALAQAQAQIEALQNQLQQQQQQIIAPDQDPIIKIILENAPFLAQQIRAIFPPPQQQQQQQEEHQEENAENAEVDEVDVAGPVHQHGFVLVNDDFRTLWFTRGYENLPAPNPDVFRGFGLVGAGFDAVFGAAMDRFILGRQFGGHD